MGTALLPCGLFRLPPARVIGDGRSTAGAKSKVSPCRSAPSARPQRSLIRCGRALGALLQRWGWQGFLEHPPLTPALSPTGLPSGRPEGEGEVLRPWALS